MTTDIKLIKTLRSHAAHARFLAMLDSDSEGDMIVVREIPSDRLPADRYHFSSTRNVYRHEGRDVVVLETSHRCFGVYDVTAIA